MILLDSSTRDDHSFDGLVVFASQLTDAGYHVGIDQLTIPARLSASQKYQVARILVDTADVEITSILIVVSGSISPETLMTLRGYQLGSDVNVVALGRFETTQDRIDCNLKISYAIGRQPAIIDLDDFQGTRADPALTFPLAGNAGSEVRTSGQMRRLCVILPPDGIAELGTLRALATIHHSRKTALRVVTSRAQKDVIEESQYSSLPVTEYDEYVPGIISRQSDVAAFFGTGFSGDRMVALAYDMILQGRIVIDSTTGATLAKSGAPCLRGPVELAILPDYLNEVVWPNLEAIHRKVASSTWQGAWSIDRLAEVAKLAMPEARTRTMPQASPKTLFLPTNGVGLGHARRCLVIANAMKTPQDRVFAAFPSCVPMIEGNGYSCLPLVQRSDQHTDPYANDIVNYLRLGDNLRKGDRLVFDGGFVFRSVCKTIVEKELSAVWIRRGLWLPAHITSAALRHENIFKQVIVPAEAFDELNHDYSFGAHIHRVGPIVAAVAESPADRSKLLGLVAPGRQQRAVRIVVTMLGSGVVTERDAQIRFICNEIERRSDVINLIVVWPSSTVPPDLYCWKNSHVVQTRNALAICQMADLVITAAGYNSFHEVLYHGIPSIFIPQSAPSHDDQEQRARAASNRGLAATVLATELLRLAQEIRLFLDDGKANDTRKSLAAFAFPIRGTATAAALIEGLEQ